MRIRFERCFRLRFRAPTGNCGASERTLFVHARFAYAPRSTWRVLGLAACVRSLQYARRKQASARSRARGRLAIGARSAVHHVLVALMLLCAGAFTAQ
eukprot:scaffold200691_cov33-Tisochrysis_lutea.AAC.3